MGDIMELQNAIEIKPKMVIDLFDLDLMPEVDFEADVGDIQNFNIGAEQLATRFSFRADP